MKVVNTSDAPAAVGPYSQGMEANGFFFFAGQIALMPDGTFLKADVQAQAKQVLKNIEALLLSQGLSKKQVVKTTMFLDDMGDFAAVNAIYADYFGDHKPARSTIEVARLPLDAKVEIEVVAVLESREQ